MQINHLLQINGRGDFDDFIYVLLEQKTVKRFNLLLSKLQGFITVYFAVLKSYGILPVSGTLYSRVGKPDASRAKTSQLYSF